MFRSAAAMAEAGEPVVSKLSRQRQKKPDACWSPGTSEPGVSERAIEEDQPLASASVHLHARGHTHEPYTHYNTHN